MSRFDLDTMIQQASSMAATATSSTKQPRWQRKNDSQLYNSFNVSNAFNQTHDLMNNLTMAERRTNNQLNESLLPSSQNLHNSLYQQQRSTKTPGKTPNSKKSSQNSDKTAFGLTPSAKTPSRHANNASKAQLPKTPKTPIHSGMDRYIPNRNGMDLEKSHYLMTQANRNGQENDPNLREKLGSNLDQYRIMCYTDKAPVASEGQASTLNVAYSSSKGSASCQKKATRPIPSLPDKILDAPEIINDWYLNLLSWNSSNILSVALNNTIYLWSAITGETKCLFQLPEDEYISSVSWIQEGNHLAIGTSQNYVEIWDVDTQTRLRQMGGHSQRVTSLDWNAHILTSGSKSGLIFHHDVRIPEHHISTLNGHDGSEVCGLKWSPDGKYLASGANDNKANIWSASSKSLNQQSNIPVHQLGHQSAIKALAWCPWKPHLLATGGGSTDRMLKVWNSSNANCLHSVDTKSQISGVEWNEEYQELITAHGFQNCELNIWKYPNMTKVTELRGHSLRILGMCMSPDKSTVVSLSADETLRFWECFPIDTQKKKKVDASTKKMSINPIRMSLR